MKQTLSRIETAIAGDEKMGTKGIVHLTREQESRIIELEGYRKATERTDAKRVGMALGAGIAGGAGIHGIWTMIKSFF